jgi:uncharacterized protein YjbI with pentapeptide repeats
VEVTLGTWHTRRSFAGADLRLRTLDRCHFKLCDFSGANLRGASLRGVSFAGCNLTRADLRDADLSYASFGRVLTHDVSYGVTDVTGVRWDGAVLTAVIATDVLNWPFADDEIV